MEEDKKLSKWSWLGYAYTLAKGDVTKLEAVLKLNFIFTLNIKAFEKENKIIYEHYDYQRYNLRG